MLEGRAHGGPLNGIKLSATERWDGRVRIPLSARSSPLERPNYPGHYRWSNNLNTWRWHED